MAISGGPDMIQDGLVLSLDAADRNSYPGSGTTWRDLSGNNNTGTLTNGPTFSSANEGNILFDNVDDYISLGTPASLVGLQVPLTIISWARPNTTSGLKTIYGAYKAVSGGSLYSMLRIDSGVVKYYTSITGGGYQVFGNLTVSANVWYFFAVVVSGSIASPSLTIYLNNQSESTALSALSSSPDLTVNLRIAGNQAASNEVWSGNIANVHMYNRALSASEILQNYNALKSRFNL